MSQKLKFSDIEKEELLRHCADLVKVNPVIWGRKFWKDLVAMENYTGGRSWESAKNCVKNISLHNTMLWEKHMPGIVQFGKVRSAVKGGADKGDGNTAGASNVTASKDAWSKSEGKEILMAMLEAPSIPMNLTSDEFWKEIHGAKDFERRTSDQLKKYFFAFLSGNFKRYLSPKEAHELEEKLLDAKFVDAPSGSESEEFEEENDTSMHEEMDLEKTICVEKLDSDDIEVIGIIPKSSPKIPSSVETVKKKVLDPKSLTDNEIVDFLGKFEYEDFEGPDVTENQNIIVDSSKPLTPRSTSTPENTAVKQGQRSPRISPIRPKEAQKPEDAINGEGVGHGAPKNKRMKLPSPDLPINAACGGLNTPTHNMKEFSPVISPLVYEWPDKLSERKGGKQKRVTFSVGDSPVAAPVSPSAKPAKKKRRLNLEPGNSPLPYAKPDGLDIDEETKLKKNPARDSAVAAVTTPDTEEKKKKRLVSSEASGNSSGFEQACSTASLTESNGLQNESLVGSNDGGISIEIFDKLNETYALLSQFQMEQRGDRARSDLKKYYEQSVGALSCGIETSLSAITSSKQMSAMRSTMDDMTYIHFMAAKFFAATGGKQFQRTENNRRKGVTQQSDYLQAKLLSQGIVRISVIVRNYVRLMKLACACEKCKVKLTKLF